MNKYIKYAFALALPPVGYCLLYTSDAADDLIGVDLGGRRSLKKKKESGCCRGSIALIARMVSDSVMDS